MSHSRSLALIVAAALTAALAPAALASPAAPVSADRADQARAEHERIVAFWTPERMKAAKPRGFVRQKDGSFTLSQKPAAGKPGGGASLTFPVSGGTSQPWPSSLADAQVQRSTGKVYFTLGRSGYVCSASVVGDGNQQSGNSVVLTAAHCAYDWRKGFASKWMFIPDFDSNPVLNTSACSAGGSRGCWTATALRVHKDFISAGAFNRQATTNDFAFAVVGPGGREGAREDLDSVVTPNAITTAPLTTANAFGYPAAGSFDGTVLTYCSASVFDDPYNGKATWGLPCDMTGGSSGGPWFDSSPNLPFGAGGSIGSLNSYGYTGYTYMFGPKFSDKTLAVYFDAKNGPAGGSYGIG